MNTKQISKLAITSLSVLSLNFALSNVASALVYTAGNELDNNEIIAFDVDSRGRINEVGRFDTEGGGTGTPLANQGALATDAGDQFLFAVNPGDGTISSMNVEEQSLSFINRVSSGGSRPLSISVFGDLVYVLNEGNQDEDSADYLRYDNISGFRFGENGALEPIEGSTRILNNTRGTGAVQVSFNNSGTVLLVTERATNMITTFVVGENGLASESPLKRESAVPTPFGFAFGDRDYVFITEANGGGIGSTVSYHVNPTTGQVSSAIDQIEMGNALCWTVLSSDQTVGYGTNTADGTVSLYNVNFDGTMDYFFRSSTDTPVDTGAGVRDAVLLQNNQFLFTLNTGDSEVGSFWVNRSGAIAPRGTLSVPSSSTGLLAL